MVYGLLQKVTMTAAPDLLMQGGLQQFEQNAGPLTPEQRAAVDAWLPRLRQQAAAPPDGARRRDADGRRRRDGRRDAHDERPRLADLVLRGRASA